MNYVMSGEARDIAFSLKLQPNGIRRIGDYRDIDIAVANEVNKAFDNISVDSNQRNIDFLKFLERDQKHRVVFGQFDDIRDFIRALRRSRKVDVSTSEKGEVSKTADSLPVVNVSRTMSYDFGNTDRQITRYYGQACDASGETVAVVDAVPVSFQYKITVAAWDKISIDYMVNAITSNFFAMRSSTGFSANQVLMNCLNEIECAFVDTLAITFDDSSALITDQRLYASEALISVNADMLVAWEVTQVVEKWASQVGITMNER